MHDTATVNAAIRIQEALTTGRPVWASDIGYITAGQNDAGAVRLVLSCERKMGQAIVRTQQEAPRFLAWLKELARLNHQHGRYIAVGTRTMRIAFYQERLWDDSLVYRAVLLERDEERGIELPRAVQPMYGWAAGSRYWFGSRDERARRAVADLTAQAHALVAEA